MAAKSAYGASSREICELFTDYIEGDGMRCALALSTEALDGASRTAIDKSLTAFGYAPESCTFATCENLDPQAVYLLIEGIDPLFVIATDRRATSLLSQAYRDEFPLDAPIRVAGRSGVAFADLGALMTSPESKQIAWRLMKTLPR